MATQRVSMNPDTFQAFAGIDDMDVIIKDARFTFYDYNNPAEGDKLVLGIQYEEVENPGKTHDQYYSAGDKRYFVPCETQGEEGLYLVPTGARSAMSASTNAAQWIGSMKNAGFDTGLFDGPLGMTACVGAKVHVNQTAQPKRSGIVRTGKNPDREPTILLVTRLLEVPGQQAPAQPPTPASAPVAAAKKGLGTAKNPPAPVTPAVINQPASPSGVVAGMVGGVDIKELTQTTLFNMLAENGGTMAKKTLPTAAFKALSDQPQPVKAAVVQMIFDDKFLSTALGITYDGSQVTLG